MVSTGKVFVWAVCYLSNFRNHNFSGRFLNSSCKPFAQGTMDVSLEHPNILEFGIYWQSICLGSVLFGQIFVTTISLAVLRIVRASHLLSMRWTFFWNIPKNNILEFGAY